MPITNSRPLSRSSANQKGLSEVKASHTPVRRKAVSNDGYAFPKKKVVPPGDYRSKIVDIKDAVTKAGDQAVDVFYDLRDADNRTYHVKIAIRWIHTSLRNCAMRCWMPASLREADCQEQKVPMRS